MKPGQSVTFRQLQAAYADVQRELARVGLWYEGTPLVRADVFWCTLPPPDLQDAKAFFINGAYRPYRAFGFEAGHIYVPKRVLGAGFEQHCGSLRDVLRHEYGHALAYYYPGPIQRSRAFVSAFGARYNAEWVDPPADAADFVTHYAMTSPMEDFAETFAHWLRNPLSPIASLPRFRGNPSCRATPALRAKLRFVRGLCRRLARREC